MTGLNLLMDRKAFNLLEIFDNDSCRFGHLNLIRVSLRIAFQKLVTLVQKKTLEQPNFILTTSFIPSYLKQIVTVLKYQIDTPPCGINVILICKEMCDHFLKLKKVCDLNDVEMPPNWLSTAVVDILESNSLLNIYKSCSKSLRASNAMKLGDSLTSSTFMVAAWNLILRSSFYTDTSLITNLLNETITGVQNLCNTKLQTCAEHVRHLQNKRNLVVDSKIIYLKVRIPILRTLYMKLYCCAFRKVFYSPYFALEVHHHYII